MGVSANYQLLSEQDVKAIQQGSNGAATLQNFINQGLIKDNGDGTYSGDVNKLGAQANIWASSNAAGVGNVDGAKDPANVTPAPGTGVERTGNPEQKKGVTTVVTTTHTATLGSLVQALGIDLNDGEINDLKQVLQDEGIEIDGDGNMSFNNKTQIEQACMKFAKDHGMSYVEGKDEGGKAKLEELATANEDALTPNGDGSYTINEGGEDLINKAFNPKGKPTEFVDEQPLSLNVKTTTTTVEENAVEVPPNLKDKTQKKQYTDNVKAAVAEIVDDEDTATLMNGLILNECHSKKIEKQFAKILKECHDKPEEVLDKYLDYLPEDSADRQILEAALKLADELPDDVLAKTYGDIAGEPHYTASEFAEHPGDREKAVKMYVVSSTNFNTDAIVEKMACADVYNSLSDKQIEKDKQKFIKAETKRQVAASEAEQNIKNTRIYFSKEQAKEAEKTEADPTIMHKPLTRSGRKLVQECPTDFGIEANENDYDFKGNDGKYYKFSQDKYVAMMKRWANPDNDKAYDFEKDGKYYKFSQKNPEQYYEEVTNKEDSDFEKDGKYYKFSQENPEQYYEEVLDYREDLFMTLGEAREGGTKMRSLHAVDHDNRASFAEVVGNGNGKMNNRKVNKRRRDVELAGLNVDKNKTGLKRFGEFAKMLGIDALSLVPGVAVATAAAGTVTAVAHASTKGGLYTGRTEEHSIDWSFDTEAQSFDVSTHFEASNGEVFDKTTTVPVPSQHYEGSVLVPSEDVNIYVPGDEDTQTKKASNKKAGIYMGLASAAIQTGLMIPGILDVTADGTPKGQDKVLNLTRKKVTETEPTDESMDLKLQRNVTEQTMECEQPGKQIDNWPYTIKVRKKDSNTNEADDKVDIVRRIYGITDEANLQTVYKWIMNNINNTEQIGTLQYSQNLTYYFPKEIPAGTISGIDYDLTSTDPSKFQYNKNEIPLGGSNAKNNTQTNLNTPGSTARIKKTIVS